MSIEEQLKTELAIQAAIGFLDSSSLYAEVDGERWMEVSDADRRQLNREISFLRIIGRLKTHPSNERLFQVTYSFPFRCELCDYDVTCLDDLDWHGFGNCVDICACCTGAGERDGEPCALCKGRGYEREPEEGEEAK